jgi:hypothetical protein
MNHELTKFGRRLLHDTNGQVLLLGVIVIIALLAFMLAIPNGTQVTTQKMRAQTAADAGAFTGAVWRARALNLNANMNVGIKSMYTWMTVLTTASALAKALYSDSLDASVRALGQDVSLALFGNNDPVYVSSSIYPQSIQKLAETARWLYDLQDDIAGSFPAVAATLGSAQARRNASGGNPLSQNPGGVVLVGAEALLSLAPSHSGDSLMYADLNQLAVSLRVIPTNDDNIGPATGVVLIDTHNFEIKAYYGDSSQWCTVRQVLKRMYKKPIIQTFRNKSTGVIDTGIEYFQKPGGGPYTSYLHGDSWARWVWKCNEGGTHTPFIWPNPQTYKNTSSWELVDAHPGNNRYKRDTVWVRKHVVKKSDPSFGKWNTGRWDPGDSILPECKPWVSDSGDEVDSSIAYPTDFYTGADSTRGNQGTKLRPRRLNPGPELYAASYVWWLGDDHAPLGLGPAIGKSLFPRSRTAATSPMLAVARAEPYLARANPTEDDYFFSPDWDVRLTPLDSAAVQKICADTAYASHSLNSINLEDLRRYVLLP